MNQVMSTEFLLIFGHIATTPSLGYPTDPLRLILDTRVYLSVVPGSRFNSLHSGSKSRYTSHHVRHHPRSDPLAHLCLCLRHIWFRDQHPWMGLHRQRVDSPSSRVGQVLRGFPGPCPPPPNRASSTSVPCIGATLDGNQRPGPREIRRVPL